MGPCVDHAFEPVRGGESTWTSGDNSRRVAVAVFALFTWLADLFAGGKRRRLERAQRRLRAAFDNRDERAHEPADLARIYGRTVRLAMRIKPADALQISRDHDSEIAAGDYAQAFPADERGWLERHSHKVERHGLAVCMQVARRLSLPDISERSARGLGELLARAGDANPLIAHLDTCRRAELLSADLLGACLDIFVAEHSLADDRETWLKLFAHIPAADIPDLFAVHALLGRSNDAVRLAATPAQQRIAVELCLSAHFLDGAVPGVPLAEELGDGQLTARLCEHIGDLYAAADDDAQALTWYQRAGADSALSRCHERLDDIWQALRTCPASERARVCELVDRCQATVHELAEGQRYQDALDHIATLCTALDQAARSAPDGDPDGDQADSDESDSDTATTGESIQRRLDDLRAHRDAVSASARGHFTTRLADLTEDDARKQLLLSWSRLEESAGNLRDAGQRAEEAGELYLAHRLYRAGEHFGDAIRVLSAMRGDNDNAGSAEQITRDIALALRDGGDFVGAADAFRDMGSYGDAQHCYTRAGDHAAAAECVRARLGDRPEESADWSEWIDLMVRAEKWQSVLGECLQAARRQAGRAAERGGRVRGADVSVVTHLRDVLSGPAAERAPAPLVSEARAFLDSLQTAERGQFDRHIDGWFRRARKATDERYASTWGLDLGTTNCAVAIYDKQTEKPVLCPWKGESQFPSTLGLDRDGREVVGLTQEQLLADKYVASVYAAKRHMGQKKRFRLGERRYRPEEVAARLIAHARTMIEDFLAERVLDRVRELAAEALGDVPDDWLARAAERQTARVVRETAVVTIPAFFLNNQKHGTRDACAIAGVTVKRLLHEPTAACVAASRARSLGGRVVVVDLGAGTLDLSAVEVDDKLQEVIQVSGDTRYGGRDHDAAIYKTLKARLRADHDLDVSADPVLRKRLELAAECLKIDLSLSESASYTLHGVVSAGAGNVTLTLSRTEFQRILSGPLQTLEQTCEKFLGELSWQPTDLILVGGPVLSPLIRERIERAFGRKATQVADPRLLVAQGAALQAAALDGSIKHALLLDVVPLALGIQVVDDRKDRNPVFSELIPANTTIPVRRQERYSTVDDNQPVVAIRIFQGALGDDSKLGEFRLEGISPAKAGEPQIDVEFELTADCVLTVTAYERPVSEKPDPKKREGSGGRAEQRGQKKSITIHDTTLLSPAERGRMAARFAEQRERQAIFAELRTALSELDSLVRDAAQADLKEAASAWRERLEARRFPMNPTDREAQSALMEMFNGGTDVEARAGILQLRLDDLAATIRAFIESAGAASKPGQADPDAVHAVRAALDAAAGYREKLQALVDESRPTRETLASWSALLARLATRVSEPLPRFVACHEVGDHAGATSAFARIPAGSLSASLIRRQLDCLAASNRHEGYRQAFLEHRDTLGVEPLDGARLERFVERISASIGWIQGRTSTGQRFTGSGFLVGDRLLATNRHVVLDSDPMDSDSMDSDSMDSDPAAPVAPDNLTVHLAGRERAVVAIHLPAERAADVALLELAEPCTSRPLSLGYGRVARVGQQVVAVGFPWADPDRSFEDNFEVQAGVINKFEAVGEAALRYIKVGIRIGPGMSGGPVFNDLGEVIGIVTLGKLAPLFSRTGAAHYEQSSYALAVEPLRAMLPPPWSDADGAEGR